MLKTFVLSFLIILNLKSTAQTFTPITTYVNSGIQGYYEYLPADYKTSAKEYPLIIFLHGIGECGNGSANDLKKVLYNGLPTYISNGKFPSSFKVNGQQSSFVVICPQLNDNIRQPSVITTLLDYCVQKYRIDKSRIYITGLSMGGGLAEVYTGENTTLAKRVAGMLSVCGNTYPYPSLTQIMAKVNLPTWFTQNTGDNIVDPTYSPKWYNALNANNPVPNPKPLLNMFSASGHDAWTQTYDPNWKPNGLNVYEWMLQYYRKSDGSIGITSSSSAPSTATPVAKISGTLSLLWPLNSTTLSGSGSTSANGSISTYRWKVTSGPSAIKLGDTTAANLSVSSLTAGTYGMQLTVKDNLGMSATTNANIVVTPLLAPVINITGTLGLTLPANSTTLSAGTSTTTNGSISSYSWKYVSGPSTYTLGATNASTLSISNLVAGTYTFQATITDSKGMTATSNASVVVNAAAVVTPVAKITGTLNFTLPTNSTTLSAAGSTSGNGSISGYSWKYVSGPSTYTLGATNASTLAVSNLIAGTYVFQVTVTDNKNITASSTASVVVSPVVLATPVAKITGTLNLTLPANTTTLSASGSTSGNGSISGYSWKYVSGPSPYTLGTTTASTLAVSNLVTGSYTFQVTVTDNKNVTATAQAVVLVNGASSGSDCGCNVTLKPNPDGGIYASGSGLGVKPGNKVCIKSGTYSYIYLYNFNGTTDQPVTLSNCGGQVIVAGDTYGFIITKSSFFKFSGTGSSLAANGFKANGTGRKMYSGLGVSLSTDFEVDHVEVTGIGSGIGVMIKTTPNCDPSTWESALTMKNVDLHDISVSNISKGEGIYIGYGYKSTILSCSGSSLEVFPQKINNLKIHSCTTNNTGWDGIQLTSVPVNCQVYDNKVQNYGTANIANQQTGILFGANCNGNVYNNYIATGSGPGLQVFGEGKVNVYNNIIANAGQDGVLIDGRPFVTTAPKLTVFVANNTVNSSGRDNIRIANSVKATGTDNYFYNNLSIAPAKNYLYADNGATYAASNNLNIANAADAYLTNASSGDYSLTSLSPAVNAGKDLTASGIKSDKIYTARPQAAAFDIGAYEFIGSSARTVTNLSAEIAFDEPANTLDGSKSYSSGNAVINEYKWTVLSGPSKNVTFSNPGAAVTKLSAQQPGTYQVELKVTNNQLLSVSKIVTIEIKGTETKLSLYPVPAKDRVNVMIAGKAKGKLTVRLVDLQGRILLEKDNLQKDGDILQQSLDISKLKSGSYIITTVVDNKLLSSKFLKID